MLALCIDGEGSFSMAAYLGFREQVSLPEFLDIEEAVIVERDRAEAWRRYIQEHPELVGRPRPGGEDE